VAFDGDATNLDPVDTDDNSDVYVRDLALQTTTFVSRATGSGVNADEGAFDIALSGDGTVVAFESSASNLSPGDTNDEKDVFVRDLSTGRLILASRSAGTGGALGNDFSEDPRLSADGTVVVFHSLANNLVPGDTDDRFDVFLRDLRRPAQPGCPPGGTARRGTSRSEILPGSPGRDVIFGVGGLDVLSGRAGLDCLYGEDGNDLHLGGPGPDRVFGGAGNDRLAGGSGSDRLSGGPGRDSAVGASGADRLSGGPDRDRIGGGLGADRLTGGPDRDRIGGGLGADRLVGGWGRDRLVGLTGADRILTGPGRDRVLAGPGKDRVVAVGGGRDVISCGPGRDVALVDARDVVKRCERVAG
jgi:Ca2+-binding RTX toxin-like protein